jgi:hypothetical protein
MPTIQSKRLEVLQTRLDSSDPMYHYTKYEHYAKQKLYEALFKYSLWNVLNYRFTEQGLYIKIQKGDQIKRFGFYPVKYDSIYVPDQTFTLASDILDSCFYTRQQELMVKITSCCATGFYNEFGSYE